MEKLNFQQISEIGKIVCVGRNYVAHAEELGNDVPDEPLLFIKPSSSVVSIHEPISITTQPSDVHYEAELCVQIGKPLINANIEEVASAISAVTLGLDLTFRDIQSELKAKGHPWERAKAFAGSCVLADWLNIDDYQETFNDFTDISYQLFINESLRQTGQSSLMLFPVYELLVEISKVFGLQKGDVIMTGTPKGVGILNADDKVTLSIADQSWSTVCK